MYIVGDDDVDREYMIEMGEIFYIELYGKTGKKVDSLDHRGEIMSTKPKCILISRISPTGTAFRFDMLRVH